MFQFVLLLLSLVSCRYITTPTYIHTKSTLVHQRKNQKGNSLITSILSLFFKMPKASATKIISLSILSFLTTASAYTTAGCYSSAGQLTSAGTNQFQSEGYCQQICTKQNKPVFALHNGDECYCGDSLPPSTAKVSSTQCQTPCSGFPSETCTYTSVTPSSTAFNDHRLIHTAL